MIYTVYFVELNLHILLLFSLFSIFKKEIDLKAFTAIIISSVILNHLGIIDEHFFNLLRNNNVIHYNTNPQVIKVYVLIFTTAILFYLSFNKKQKSTERRFITIMNIMTLLSIFAFHNTFIYNGLIKNINDESMNRIRFATLIESSEIFKIFCNESDKIYCLETPYREINNKDISILNEGEVEKDIIKKSFNDIIKNKKDTNIRFSWSYSISFTKGFLFGYKSDGKTFQRIVIDNTSNGQNFIENQKIFSTMATISSSFWLLIGFGLMFAHKRKIMC